MNAPQLSESARRVLRDDIGSLERLDVLLLMQHDAERWWTAAALARELRIAPMQVEASLHALGRGNLLEVRVAEDVLYRYDPGAPALRQVIEEIVEFHYANRTAVAAILSAAHASGAELFAEAFRLRKDSDDG
jgi:hypothetical protein